MNMDIQRLREEVFFCSLPINTKTEVDKILGDFQKNGKKIEIQSDRLMRLHELRIGMWECFMMLSRTPEDDPVIEEFINFMDQHQETLSKIGCEV